ncbi:splicing factor [Tanacetum coccineum]
MGDLSVTLHHDGVFIPNPCKYVNGRIKVLNETRFEEMQVGKLFKIINKLTLSNAKHIYYCVRGTTLTLGVREIKTYSDMMEFMRIGYENDNRMELFAEHHGYDVLQYSHNDNLASDNEQSDVDLDYEGESDLENVDFHTEGEQGVELEKLSIDDPFLNKLVGNGNFIGTRSDPIPPLVGNYHVEADDPEDEIIDGMHKADKGIKYPAYDPEQPWNENKPVLGMRYESPQQLKHALANYGVANGFKLWYYRNDADCLLVFCGRDLSIGRCASKKKLSNKDNLSPQGKGKGETQGNGKGEHQQKAKEKGKGKMDEQSQEKVKWTKARCKRAKQLALYEHEGGLIEHYGKLWEYRQAVLESNPGSTCHKDQEVLEDDGKIHFTRMEDAKTINVPYLLWAVIKVENKNNWCWFMSLLCDDLDLQDGLGITIISDGHKGLIEATAASSTVEQNFLNHMDEIKRLDPEAYAYLMGREPGSWCRAFFQPAVKCASFENGISESFNSRLVNARGKPIITMLEDIRVYVMQRNWALSKQASELDDNICPSIRKKLNILKKQQRSWQVFPSGYQVLEVRKKDEAYGVNLIERSCVCKLWDISGIPCVHAVASYMHLHMDPDLGVSSWYSQSKWFDAYQFSIKPVSGSKMWKSTSNTPPLPPLVPKMPGRPRKKRIRHPTENDHEVSRLGRLMTCQLCYETGHNKSSCTRGQQPKPPKPCKTPKPPSNKQYSRMGRIKITDVGGSISKRGGGSGVGRGGGSGVGRGGGSVGRGGGSVGRGGGSVGRGNSKRGGGSVGRGGACNSKRGGRSITSKGSGSVGRGGLKRGGSNSMDTEEEQFRKDQEAQREVMEEWEGDGFEEPNPNLRLATMSDLVAADEAHDEHFNNMPSLTNDVSLDVSHIVEANNVVVPNNEQPTPDAAQTSSQSSRVVLHPRPRSERIAKRRKVNLAAGTTSDKPIYLVYP